MISLPRLVPCFILNFALCSAGSTVDGSKIGGSTEPEAKIIIIGSGAAGIAAASQLAKNNFKNIIILEAENRIGGRIHSVHFGGSIVDLGAEWCTSEKNNIVYQLAGGLNVLKDDPYDNIEYYRSSGKYPNDGFIREIQSLVIKIYKETENVTGYMVDDFRQKTFPQPWWPEHVHRFSFIWSKEDRKRASKEFPYGPKIQGHSWILAIESLSTSKFNSNILTVWMCGELVPSIEKLEDDIIVNGTMFLLFKFLGNQYNVTRPEKIVREKWHTNDHFRGAYSYNTLQSHAEGVSQREILSKPLEATDGKPVILFAGEATNPIHFGTVHGAIETGRREADRIINYYKAEN